jgi:hypothetical protein
LVIAIGDDGTLPAGIDDLLAVRDVERVWVHARIDDAGEASLVDRFGHGRVTRIWTDDLTPHELHPLSLQPAFRDPPAGGPQLSLPIPEYDSEALARVARVAWGRIRDAARDQYGEAFLLESRTGDAAHFAVVDGQVSGLAPLAQSAYLMDVYYQHSPARARQIVIVEGDHFDDLVLFWNLRSRATTHVRRDVVAIPREALGSPERLRSLAEWVAGERDVVKPDLLVNTGGDPDAVREALTELGFREASEGWRLTEYWGEVAADRQQLEFALVGTGLVGGPMRRGVATHQLVSLEVGRRVHSVLKASLN